MHATFYDNLLQHKLMDKITPAYSWTMIMMSSCVYSVLLPDSMSSLPDTIPKVSM